MTLSLLAIRGLAVWKQGYRSARAAVAGCVFPLAVQLMLLVLTLLLCPGQPVIDHHKDASLCRLCCRL